MSGTVFDAKIRGIDQASGALQRIAQSLRGLIESTKGLTTATKGLTRAHAEGHAAQSRYIAALSEHFHGLREHLSGVREGIKKIGESIAEFLPILGTLGAVGSLVGLFELTKSVSEAGVELEMTAKKLGITEKQFGGLSYAAKLVHVPVEALTGGIEKFNKTLGLLATGHGTKAAIALMNHLHIRARGQNPAELMIKLADAFIKTKDSALRAFMATTLFGKSGQELLPLLMQTTEALREQAREGARLVYVPSDEERRGMHEFEDSWIGLEGAVAGFKKEIGARLAPVLAPLIEHFKEWLLVNRHWIATKIVENVKMLGDWLKKLDIKQISDDTTDWIKSTSSMVDTLGGLRTILGAVALLIASPLISAAISATAAFYRLGTALFVAGYAALANPFGLVILALAVVIGQLALLYLKWDELTAFFTKQDGWVKQLLMLVAPIIFVPIQIQQAWEPLRPFFTTLWRDIQKAFEDPWSVIKPIIETLRDFGTWIGNSTFAKTLSDIAGGVKDQIPDWHSLIPHAGPRTSAPANPGAMPGGANPLLDPTLGPMMEPHSENQAPRSLYRDGGPVQQAALAPRSSDSRITVAFENTPRNARVTTEHSGDARLETNVGYISPMPALA